jgi:uncharacterized protein (TIGR02453 family)
MENTTIRIETLAFLKQIETNNNKAWFDENKKQWEAVKENYAAFMGELQDKIKEIDYIEIKEPKKYVSRINRDFRFTADKSPYRNNIFSLIERGSSENSPRFYLQIQPGDNSFIACGLWSPDNDTLKKIRSEIAHNSDELFEIIKKESFLNYFGNIQGETLARPPQGYDANSPNLELLKLKQYIAKKTFTDKEVLAADFNDNLFTAYQEVLPFLNFLDSSI